MRSHGEPAFPDPDSNGDFITGGIDNRTAVYLRADNTCRHLLPNGGAGTAAQDQAAVRAALKFAQCMRAHGITNYPDPSVQSGGAAIGLGGTGVDPSAPQVKSASQACAPILHGGGS